MYQVVVNGKVVKEYEHKLQAIIWCFLKGYGYEGKGYRWIIGAEIREVKNYD